MGLKVDNSQRTKVQNFGPVKETVGTAKGVKAVLGTAANAYYFDVLVCPGDGQFLLTSVFYHTGKGLLSTNAETGLRTVCLQNRERDGRRKFLQTSSVPTYFGHSPFILSH